MGTKEYAIFNNKTHVNVCYQSKVEHTLSPDSNLN